MSGWLRNLQGQLTELASEVLSEATEEIEDPESELQVLKKKLDEAEQQLLAERSHSELLQNKLANLKEELYSKNIEFDTMTKKYASMVESRDREIRLLQVELERQQHKNEADEHSAETDDEEFLSDKSVLIGRLKLKNEEMSKEIQHWKRIANSADSENDMQKVVELESKLSELKRKSEAELAALIQAHREDLEQLKSFYEEKLSLSGTTNEEERSVPLVNTAMQTDEVVQGERYSAKIAKEDSKLNDSEVTRPISENVVAEYDKNFEEAKTENERFQNLCKMQSVELAMKIEEIAGLQSDLADAHSLIDIQREKYEKELSEEKAKISPLLAEVEKFKIDLKNYEQKYDGKDHEIEKLKTENRELTAAYNDLNEEFENHRAEHGSVVTSNRDLNIRIDTLKANLIEYEEKYELCKAENAETVKQLEKLTSDFENLRVSFESTKETSSFDSVGELERLRSELEIVKHDRERLRADVDRFTQSVKSIDVELNKLRTANKKLEQDNAAMALNLDLFMDIRNTLEKRDQELKEVYAEIRQLQEENNQNEETRKALDEVTKEKDRLVKELEECCALVLRHENAMREYRAIVGNHAADVIEKKNSDDAKNEEDKVKLDASNQESTIDDVGDIEVTTSSEQAHHHKEELKEVLAMVTEITDECDELRRQKGELEKELDMKQSCIDELMSQMNSLQAQQQIQAESFNEVRDWLKESDNKKLVAERSLVRLKEEFQKTIVFYDVQINLLNDFISTNKTSTLRKTLSEGTEDETWMTYIETIRESFLKQKMKQQQYLDDNAFSLSAEEAIKLNEEMKKNGDEYEKAIEEIKIIYEEKLKRSEEEKSICNNRLNTVEQTKVAIARELDDLKTKFNSLQEEKKSLSMQLSELSFVAKELDELKTNYNQLQQEKELLSSQLYEFSVKYDKKEQSDVDYKQLERTLKELEGKYNTEAQKNLHLNEELEKNNAGLMEMERVRGELIKLVEQKHAESTNYHAQLQTVIGEKNSLQSDLQGVIAKLSSAEEHLLKMTETKDKALSECERLRKHLLNMEESFTREAIAAEERETELRSKVRQLELKTEETADNVISSSNAYEKRLEELTNEVNVLKNERDRLIENSLEKSNAVEKSEKALDDLRKIVRDINADHESQTATYESQISKLKAEIKKFEKEIENMYSTEETLLGEKENLLAVEKTLREELLRKDSVIDELETQLDEKVQGSSNSKDGNGHIDDEILRQLFLSYFTAEASKKPEIALLLMSVLKYSPEDAAKIQAANASTSRGWFGFSSSQKSTQSGPSIAEQFISFLERESIRPSSHSLPLQSSADNATIRQSPLPSASNRYSDSGDLRSILDS